MLRKLRAAPTYPQWSDAKKSAKVRRYLVQVGGHVERVLRHRAQREHSRTRRAELHSAMWERVAQYDGRDAATLRALYELLRDEMAGASKPAPVAKATKRKKKPHGCTTQRPTVHRTVSGDQATKAVVTQPPQAALSAPPSVSPALQQLFDDATDTQRCYSLRCATVRHLNADEEIRRQRQLLQQVSGA